MRSCKQGAACCSCVGLSVRRETQPKYLEHFDLEGDKLIAPQLGGVPMAQSPAAQSLSRPAELTMVIPTGVITPTRAWIQAMARHSGPCRNTRRTLEEA